MAEQKSEPERAADAQPAAEEPVTNSEEAQEAVDVYRAGVANANAGDAEVVTPEEPPGGQAPQGTADAPAERPADENPVTERPK